MKDSDVTYENLTGVEIMHYTLLFCYNWREEDFRIAFKDSLLGWNYYWKKLQSKIKDDINATQAIVEVVLNMDNRHRQVFFEYLFGSLYPDKIKQSREMKILIDEKIKEQRSK